MDFIPELEEYLKGYMAGLIKLGYLKQFFNVEIWGLQRNGGIEFCFCEINPRCAHAYHIPYQIAYGTNLWSDNFNLVLYNQAPKNTPWNKWRMRQYKVSCQILINVMGSQGKRVDEILDYTLVDHWDFNGKVELVRHTKQRDYVITADDAASGAGCTLLQIFVKCTSHGEAAAYEVAVRDLVYKIKQDCVQPDFWLALAAGGDVAACKAKLGLPKLGLLNPQKYMMTYLEELKEKYDMTYLTDIDDGSRGAGSIIDSSRPSIDKILGQCKDAGLPCVVGLAQKDSWQHSILNREMGHVSISSLAYLIAMNKYMQRVLEEEAKTEKGTFFFAPVTPETETNEQIAAKVPKNEWPIMLKNTSLSLGKGVFRVKTPEKLFEILDEYRANKKLQAAIKATNDGITDWFGPEDTKRLKAMGEFVPPFLFEHCVNLDDGWVEYCYEGAIQADGTLTHYGFTEELYDSDHAGIAYVTPPMSYPEDKIPELEVYLNGYMAALIKRGYLKQFFNVEIR